MNNINKKAAEIFVTLKYAEQSFIDYFEGQYFYFLHIRSKDSLESQICNPFVNTLVSRQQLDILEKYYRVQTQQNSQGDVNASNLDGEIKTAGNSPRYSRIAIIENCLRRDIKNEVNT